MADLSDVSVALVTLIANTLYPNGMRSASLVANPVKIYPGWPIARQLQDDLQNHVVTVSVYPAEHEVNTTRALEDLQPISMGAISYAAAIDATGTQITFSGAAPQPYTAQNVAVIVNNLAFVYQTQPGDAPATIAQQLAALINPAIGAQAAGGILTIAAAHALIVRIGATGTAMKEVGRQKREYQIVIWAETPALRAAVAKLIHPALAATPRLPLVDGSTAWLSYARSIDRDEKQPTLLYRRDLFFTAEYPTTISETDAQPVVGVLNVSGGISPTGALQPAPPALATENL